MAMSHKPHKHRPVRENGAYGPIFGAVIGALLGVIAIGPHLSEWSTSKSLGSILAPALVGLLFGFLATNSFGPYKPGSGTGSSTNDSPYIGGADFHLGEGHSGSHSNDVGCSSGSDGGGDGGGCGGGD